jgi:hypothetical protein
MASTPPQQPQPAPPATQPSAQPSAPAPAAPQQPQPAPPEPPEETKILEIESYTGELKDFFDETKDNFKHIFFELIINTKADSENSVETLIPGTDYLANLQNIQYNWTDIIEKLTRKDALMKVLDKPTPLSTTTPSDFGAGDIKEQFKKDDHENAITTSTSTGTDYIKIIKTIKSLIYFLFHKIAHKLNEDIEAVGNASYFAEYKKKFAYNDNTKLFNSKLKIIVDEFLIDDDIDSAKDEGKTIFFINDCADLEFARKLTDKDYYKKKQDTKKLLENDKQYVDESFYRILDETISALINIQKDKLIQSDATKKMTDILKISGERFLKKYNLVGNVDIKAVGKIDMTTQELDKDNDKYLKLKPNSNNDLKKFDDDNKLFTKIADLLFISSNKSYMLGLGSAMGDSDIRGRDRHLFFPDTTGVVQPEGWGNTGALKSYIKATGKGLGSGVASMLNAPSKISEMSLDTGEVINSGFEKARRSRKAASARRQEKIIEKNRDRDEAERIGTAEAKERRAAAATAAAAAATAAAKAEEATAAADTAAADMAAKKAAATAAEKAVLAGSAEAQMVAKKDADLRRAAAEAEVARKAAEEAREAAETAALAGSAEKDAAEKAAEAAEAKRDKAIEVADAAAAGLAEDWVAVARRRVAARASRAERAVFEANIANEVAEQKENDKKTAEAEAAVMATERKKTAEAAGKAAEKADVVERAKWDRFNKDAKVTQAAAKARAAAEAAKVKAMAERYAAEQRAELVGEAQEAYARALDLANRKLAAKAAAGNENTYQREREAASTEVRNKTQELNVKKRNMDNTNSEREAAARNLDQVKQDIEEAIVNVRQKKQDESKAKATAEEAKAIAASRSASVAAARAAAGRAAAPAEAAAAATALQEAEEEEKMAISNLEDARLKVQRAEAAVTAAETAETLAQGKITPASTKLQTAQRTEEAAQRDLDVAIRVQREKEIELERLMQRAAEEKALPTKLLKDVKAARKARDILFDKTLKGPAVLSKPFRRMERGIFGRATGGSINDSISNVENTYDMIGGLKLDINPKFRRGYSTKARSRNYADDPVAVDNFTMYFLEITFGLQLLLNRLFSGHDISQILTDFFSLYVKKLYTVLRPTRLVVNTKLPIIVSNYSIYEITRKIIFSCFKKFIEEKVLINDTSNSADSSDLDLSKDMILAKLSFSLPQLVDFFVDSFTNLDNLDNNILKPGSNNALINYYNLKLGNVFNTSVEKKEEFALISDELTKIFKTTDEDKKETNHLKFYREKIHKIDKIIDDHQDETFGLLIEQIQKIISGFAITEKGLFFESTEFAGLKLTPQQSELEKRQEELQKELDEIKDRLRTAVPSPAATAPPPATYAGAGGD